MQAAAAFARAAAANMGGLVPQLESQLLAMQAQVAAQAQAQAQAALGGEPAAGGDSLTLTLNPTAAPGGGDGTGPVPGAAGEASGAGPASDSGGGSGGGGQGATACGEADGGGAGGASGCGACHTCDHSACTKGCSMRRDSLQQQRGVQRLGSSTRWVPCRQCWRMHSWEKWALHNCRLVTALMLAEANAPLTCCCGFRLQAGPADSGGTVGEAPGGTASNPERPSARAPLKPRSAFQSFCDATQAEVGLRSPGPACRLPTQYWLLSFLGGSMLACVCM